MAKKLLYFFSIFVTPKLDFDYGDSIEFDENNSCEVQISMDSMKPDAGQDSFCSSQSAIDKKKDISYLVRIESVLVCISNYIT